jgi:hypothetical protein
VEFLHRYRFVSGARGDGVVKGWDGGVVKGWDGGVFKGWDGGMVKALRYYSDVSRIDSRWCHWVFQ